MSKVSKNLGKTGTIEHILLKLVNSAIDNHHDFHIFLTVAQGISSVKISFWLWVALNVKKRIKVPKAQIKRLLCYFWCDLSGRETLKFYKLWVRLYRFIKEFNESNKIKILTKWDFLLIIIKKKTCINWKLVNLKKMFYKCDNMRINSSFVQVTIYCITNEEL